MFDRARDAVLAHEPDAQAIYVYGSFARDDLRPGSDLDLAVLMPPGRKFADKLGLMAEISRQVQCDVDLVSRREAGLDLVYEVLRDGRELFSRNELQTLAWEAERMTDYSDFNLRRAPLLDMYLREPLRSRQ